MFPMQVCIYCASSSKIHSDYFDATEDLAIQLVKQKVKIVFGGGSSGLMGKLADTTLAHGGQIRGIMPQFMNEVEWGHRGVSDFIYTNTMHERKAKFLEGTDALIALPGGVGTYEELFEALTLKKLAQFTKPIVLLNTRNYFDAFMQLMQHMVNEGFLSQQYLSSFILAEKPQQVISVLKTAKDWDKSIHDASKER